MHEFSICRQIIIQVNDIALQNQASTIENITLKIGPLSGIEAPLLKQAFPFAASKTIAENAELIIEIQPVVVQCKQCDSKSYSVPNKLVCSQCGCFQTKLLSGDEMLLASVDLIKTDPFINEPSVVVNHV